MSHAEHLIENTLYALAHDQDVDEVLDWDYNRAMLESTGIKKNDLVVMAIHVVYSLYDGKYPDFPT